MARPPHSICTWKGVFTTPTGIAEEWQFSLRGRPQNLGSVATYQSLAESLMDAWDGNLRAVMPNFVALREVRVSDLGADERVTRFPEGEYRQGVNAYDLAGNGPTGGMRLPPQLAVAVSLTTARPGASGKGRFFLPYPAMSEVGSDFRLLPTVADDLASAADGFVAQVAGLLPSDGVYVVSTKGYMSRVTGIRVGRAIDTMRSRRGDLLESYSLRVIGDGSVAN